MTDEELEKLTDIAAGYYSGLWNLLVKDDAPPAIIINAAINNMLSVLSRYMTGEGQVSMLEVILKKIKEEAALEGDQTH